MASLLPFLLFSICIGIYVAPIQSAKIVGFPMTGGSQYLGMKRIAEELAKRNHEVTLLISSAEKIKPSDDLKHAIYKVPFKENVMELMASRVIKGGIKSLLFGNSSMPAVQATFCEALLKDTKLLDSFKGFDLIVTQCTQFCGPIVADYLGIRRVDFCPGPPHVPFLPSSYEAFFSVSYIPQFRTRNPLGMNFLNRVKNTLVFFAARRIINRMILFPYFQALKTKYSIRPEKSFIQSMDDKELTLFMADFAFDYARPIRPDYKLIGPVNIQPAKPLPPDLQQLIDSSGDDGAIIVSFGSNVASTLDKEKVDILAEAFGRLKQKVIWRLQGYIPSSLSPNIKPVDWLPQNDLLANEKLRAFVSHGGLNSIYEALYRGVPVVAMPLFGDQFDNSIHMEAKEVALVVDYKTLTTNHLYNTIRRVVNEPRFRENARRISRLLSDRPRSPVQEAGDWIEYTLRHGSLAHLRPYSSQLAWYQYFLVDVAVFLVLVVLVVIMVIKYTVRLLCWMCCRRTAKQKTQ